MVSDDFVFAGFEIERTADGHCRFYQRLISLFRHIVYQSARPVAYRNHINITVFIILL